MTLQDLADVLRSTTRTMASPVWDRAATLSDILDVASRLSATVHPLGFIHVNLSAALSCHPGESFRLHLWPRPHAPRADDLGGIHDHTWDLASAVVAGSLRNLEYLPRRDSVGAFNGVRVEYGSQNTFRVEGRWRIDLVDDKVVRSGEVYTIPAGIVHQTEVLENDTITVVRSMSDISFDSPGPLILVPVGTQATGTAVRRSLSPLEIQRLIREVRSRLELP